MTEHAVDGADTSAARADRVRTGWGLGWVYFGGMMMAMLGVFNLVEGLVALYNDDYYVSTPQGLLVFDITAWGWIHLITGIVAIIVGIGVFAGATWARICGVFLCGINALTQLLFLSAYPAWAVLVIALDVLVIWALIVHGGEARDEETG